MKEAKQMSARSRRAEPDIGTMVAIEHDGFIGTVQGHYVTREGKRGAGSSDVGAKQMTDHTLGDAPIEAEHIAQMNYLARMLDKFFNGSNEGADREVGFVLLVFPYGDKEGRANYISNGADRRDIVTLFREQIARFEGQPEMSGKA